MHPVTEFRNELEPIRLTFQGDFWDSQIYSDTLFLFRDDGAVEKIAWAGFVAELQIADSLRVVAEAALSNNRQLYSRGAQLLLRDTRVRQLLAAKLRRLAREVATRTFSVPMRFKVLSTEMPFLHSDSEIHYDRLFLGATDGLFSAPVSGGDRTKSSFYKHTDAPALRLAASLKTIAQAAGNDGLFETRLWPASSSPLTLRDAALVSNKPCTTCEWAFKSILGTDFDEHLYLAFFTLVRPPAGERAKPSRDRRLADVISSEKMFGHSGSKSSFMWGAEDRLYQYSHGNVHVKRYAEVDDARPSESIDHPEFKDFGQFTIAENVLEGAAHLPVSVRVAQFGSVLEFNDRLLVIATNGQTLRIDGAPARWRIFPRSSQYFNHLHVIYEDRLEVFAFTHDYFVDQSSKNRGISVGDSNVSAADR